MPYKNLITSFVRTWNFARLETLEILKSLDDFKLKFTPAGADWQPIYYQFGCMGRTQMIYTEAIKSGKMDFSLFSSESLPKKNDFQTVKELKNFLEKADREWIEAIRSKRRDENFIIVWPGFKQPLPVHITNLISHERLHQGQLISYFTLAGFELPEKFKRNWAL